MLCSSRHLGASRQPAAESKTKFPWIVGKIEDSRAGRLRRGRRMYWEAPQLLLLLDLLGMDQRPHRCRCHLVEQLLGVELVAVEGMQQATP